MNYNPPQDSNIKMETINGYQHISIPHGKAGIMRFFIGAFILFWLGGWVMGFTTVVHEILSGNANAFLIFWLGGWTIGGLFAMFTIYRIFRKPIPEQLLLNKPNMTIDTGISPFKINFSTYNQKDYWKMLLAKRKEIEFTQQELKSLQLRETDSGNRLTIDKGSERVEIATAGTEIEREWLFEYLQASYSISK